MNTTTLNSTLVRAVLVGALAGLLFGFDTAVVAGTTSGLTTYFHLDPRSLGITVSAALWGTLAGASFAGGPGDRFGARTCLTGIALLYLVSGLGCFLAWSWYSLLFFRATAGVAIGCSSVLAPVYLAEIAPAAKRGALVGTFQLNIVIGILVAYASNYLIGLHSTTTVDWRWKFGAAAIPAAVLLVLLLTIPESPRWLALKGKIQQAQAVLHRLGVSDVAAELARMRRDTAVSPQVRFNWAQYRKPVLLAGTLAAFNQLSGINAILYYLNGIFAAAGYSRVSADQQAVVIGATNLVFTALALGVIDRLGRRTLLLIGSVGLVVALSGVAAIFLTATHNGWLLWLLILFIASFAFSQGAVIWVYISEIFPTEVRSRGQSIGASVHWFMDAIIATLFPVIAGVAHGAPFVFFALMMVLQFFVVLIYFPETRQTALEDIHMEAKT